MKYYSHTIPLPAFSPLTLFKSFPLNRHSFLCESAEYHAEKGRYSFIGFGAAKKLEIAALSELNTFEELQKSLDELKNQISESAEYPFAPALFGFISFETARFTENVPLPYSEGVVPDALFFMPEVLLVADHTQKKLTLLATSSQRLDQAAKIISEIKVEDHPVRAVNTVFPPESLPLTTRKKFTEMFTKAEELIASGDLMQIVISQKMEMPAGRSDIEMYEVLRSEFPAPYMYLFHFSDFSIIGSSPETLAKIHDGVATIHPIAGTRPRGATPEQDKKLTQELLSDPKENAEHSMLIDLGRNDLGKVCTLGSVQVTHNREIEKMSSVMHLVSEVVGVLRPKVTAVEALKACFPAGTLVGAPKHRALERIIELEQTPRGIYGGAVGYIDINGRMDFAIAIRTILQTKGRIRLQAGAGIVADSYESFEDRECRIKMKAQYVAATH